MALNLAHRPLCSYASRRVTRAAASVALPSLPRPRLSGAAVPSRSSWRVLPWCLATLALAKSKDAKACQAEGHQHLRSVKLHSIEEGDSEATQIVVLVHGLDSWSGRKLSFLGVAKPFCRAKPSWASAILRHLGFLDALAGETGYSHLGSGSTRYLWDLWDGSCCFFQTGNGFTCVNQI